MITSCFVRVMTVCVMEILYAKKCFSDKRKVLEYKCMKHSRLASYLSYWESMKWNRERLEVCTDIFICPSRFMAEKMRQGDSIVKNKNSM